MNSVLLLFFICSTAYAFYLLSFQNIRLTIPGFICILTSIIIALIAIGGYVVSFWNISITIDNFLFFFSIFCLIEILLVIFLSKRRNSSIVKFDFDKKFIIGSLLIFFISAIILIYRSFPYFLPLKAHTELGDGSLHLWYARSISSSTADKLLSYRYHLGAHFNIALLSELINIPIINLIYPIVVLITSLSGVVMYTIITELKIARHLAGIAGGLFLSLSIYSFTELNAYGFYSQIFGNFLFISFILFLIKYSNRGSIINLSYPILIILAISCSNLFWSAVLLAALLYITKHLWGRSKKGLLIGSGILIAIIIVYMPSVRTIVYYAMSKLREDGSVVYTNFTNFTPQITNTIKIDIFAQHQILWYCFVLILIGVVRSLLQRKNRVILIIISFIVIQMVFLYWGVKKFSFGKYWYYKMYYLLFIPSVVMLVYGGQSVVDWVYSKIKKNFCKEKMYARIALPPLTLIIFLPLLYISLASGIAYSKHSSKVMNSAEYDVALWVTKNNYNDSPKCIYFISYGWRDDLFLKSFLNRAFPYTPSRLILPTQEAIERWIDSAGGNDYLFISQKFSNFIKPYLSRFKIIYTNGDVYFLSSS